MAVGDQHGTRKLGRFLSIDFIWITLGIANMKNILSEIERHDPYPYIYFVLTCRLSRHDLKLLDICEDQMLSPG